jgi:tetratricopeptide (TPR) repeat protein
MAFGFGFNKEKVLSAAEKFVQQGKLPNAIAEYEKILKADAKDLTVLNTVGDLYSRLGDNDKAVECFKSVGDAYATQGFTVKAIAMYKKLAKSKPSIETVLRLAELYTQQGLFNDARAQYLQVAEEFLRGGELEQAVRIFQKTLEMDPDNLPMRVRLADVYVRLGKKEEAKQVYSAAIETMRSRNQLDAAEDLLQRLIKLDPNSGDALIMRARNAVDAGDFASAAQHFEKLTDIAKYPDALRGLFQCYLQLGRVADAGTLAPTLFPLETSVPSISSYVDALLAASQYDEALAVYQSYGDRLMAHDPTRYLNSLHSLIGPVSADTTALVSILGLLNKAGDKSHDTEIYELLANAFVQSGDLAKAQDYYAQLMQLEPQNSLHAQNHKQVLARLGNDAKPPSLMTPEEGLVLVEELEASAPSIDQRHEDAVTLAVRAAITDADLFLSYNMPEKALSPLLSVLPQAPRDLRLNQRLAALHARAGRFAEGAVCCRTLESLYHDAGFASEASRYADLSSKYEARAAADGGSGAVTASVVAGVISPLAVQQIEQPTVAAVIAPPAVTKAAESAEFVMQTPPPIQEAEIDLSGEWDGSATEEAPPAEPEHDAVGAVLGKAAASGAEHGTDDLAVAETIEEIRFYLENSMPEQATAGLDKLKRLTTDAAMIGALQTEIDAASASAVPDVVVELASTDELPGAAQEVSEDVAVAAEIAPEPTVAEVPSELSVAPVADQAVAEIEQPVVVRETAPEVQMVAPTSVAPEATIAPLNSLVSDLDASLGNDFLGQPPIAAAHAAPANVETKIAPPAAEPIAAPIPVTAVAAAAPVAESTLGNLVSDLESALGDNFLPSASIPAPTQALPVAMSAAAGASASATATSQQAPIKSTAVEASAGVDLADMFGELKHELEEGGTDNEEDPETHYNLGVAFREMGLLDEAIGELQKVCQSVEKGHPFPLLMQTYTWLAQCFLDKGMPEAAVRWYNTALKLPNLDGETKTALNYELGSAHEAAGDRTAALKHFTAVYGSNIDYRDVGDRIKSLKA